MDELPSFFKVFLRSNSSKRLSIPVDFVRHELEGRIPHKVFLRNRHGKLWPLKVTKVGDDFYFTDGWVKFVEDNSLEDRDMIVFDYDWTNVFYVKIFGHTGCLKEVMGPSNVTVNEEEEEWSEENRDVVKEQVLEATTLRNGNKGKAAVKVEDDVDVFKYRMVSRPQNPYFVTKLRQKKKTQLFVPTNLIKEHGLKLPESLDILDEKGNKWPSKVTTWTDGRQWLTGGWNKFCKSHHLKLEDRCHCEFVHGEGSEGISLKIRILRKGSWLPKGESQTGVGPSS